MFDASEGRDERGRLREFWAALILLGLPMPRMEGLEIFRRLRGAGDHVPGGIILTHGPVPVTIAAVRLGAVEVLARPIRRCSPAPALIEIAAVRARSYTRSERIGPDDLASVAS